MASKVSNEELIDLYVDQGLGLMAISNKTGLSVSGIGVRVQKLRRAGLIPEAVVAARVIRARVDDVQLAEDYKTMGVYALSVKYGVTQGLVSRHLKKLGLIDSARQFKKVPGSRRSRRRKSQEFLDSTKRERFTEERGICQWCHLLIEDGLNWRIATYHHVVLAKNGGSRDPSNCMVLHRQCHEEHSDQLHGVAFDRLQSNYKTVL